MLKGMLVTDILCTLANELENNLSWRFGDEQLKVVKTVLELPAGQILEVLFDDGTSVKVTIN